MSVNCKIQWTATLDEDDAHALASIRRSNILQSDAYARAVCQHLKQKTRIGIIYINDQKAGFVRIYEASLLWNAIHGLMVDRGPLWLSGYGGAAHVKAFFDELNVQFPKRFGRKRRIIPEIEDGPTIRKILEGTGFSRLDRLGYQTLWLDVTQDDETLKAEMRKNWRGALNKGERSDLEIVWDERGDALLWMMKCYALDKAMRDYNGPDPVFLQKVGQEFFGQNAALIGIAKKEGRKIASIMLFKHGESATYQCGWCAPLGRENNANHVLLWHAVTRLREDGIKDFDLGGVNDETAKGVKAFKQGLGGADTVLVGHYV